MVEPGGKEVCDAAGELKEDVIDEPEAGGEPFVLAEDWVELQAAARESMAPIAIKRHDERDFRVMTHLSNSIMDLAGSSSYAVCAGHRRFAPVVATADL